MIENRWKQVLASKGITQAELADKVGVGRPFFSAVVKGQSVLSKDELVDVCETLGIDPVRVYDEMLLRAIYGMNVEKPKQERVSVKLTGEDLNGFMLLKDYIKAKTNVEVIRYAINYTLEEDAQMK